MGAVILLRMRQHDAERQGIGDQRYPGGCGLDADQPVRINNILPGHPVGISLIDIRKRHIGIVFQLFDIKMRLLEQRMVFSQLHIEAHILQLYKFHVEIGTEPCKAGGSCLQIDYQVTEVSVERLHLFLTVTDITGKMKMSHLLVIGAQIPEGLEGRHVTGVYEPEQTVLFRAYPAGNLLNIRHDGGGLFRQLHPAGRQLHPHGCPFKYGNSKLIFQVLNGVA